MSPRASTLHVFFFNDTATTEIYTLSLHDALPISIAAPTRQPFDTFHGRQHVVFDFINPNEKLFDGSKDYRGFRTPTMRIGVLVGLLSQERAKLFQQFNDLWIRIINIFSYPVGDTDFRSESSLCIHRGEKRESMPQTKLVIIFTMTGSDVNASSTGFKRDGIRG